MKSLFKRVILSKFTLCLVVSGLLYFTGTAAQGEYQDTIVVRMSKGTGPGEFIYKTGGGGSDLTPQSFTVDYEGRIYFPERGYSGRIRVHKFDANGRFIETLKLKETSSSGISLIAVSPAGELYLVVNPMAIKKFIYKYSPTGKLLYRLSPKGIVESEEDCLRPLKRSFDGSGFISNGEYFESVERLIAAPNGDILIEAAPSRPNKTIYRFNSQGNLVGKPKTYPPAIAERLKLRTKRVKFFVERAKQRSGIQNIVIAPDGYCYYMKTYGWEQPPGWKGGYPKELQIHKAIFAE